MPKDCRIRITIILSFLLLGKQTVFGQSDPIPVTFEKKELSAAFHAEGVAVGDIDRDGTVDIVSGPYWYQGPAFLDKYEYYPPKSFDKTQEYSDNFVVGIDDVNDDGWNDILVVGFPGDTAYWYENPKESQGKTWRRFIIHPSVDNESPVFFDIDRDDRLELVFHTEGRLGYAASNSNSPTSTWLFYPVSEKFVWGKFTHGLGVGDINGDGAYDLIKNDGWWLNPGTRRDTLWQYHQADFGQGGAQMYALDIDQDGYRDILTSLDAHGYGLAWFRQFREKDHIGFGQQTIMGSKLQDNPFGVCFSQLHAISYADINNDGLSDIITGKRVWTRGPQEGWEPDEPAVLYYFESRVNKRTGRVFFLPFIIDGDSGVGTQIATVDLNADRLVDIVTANKNGVFVFFNKGRP